MSRIAVFPYASVTFTYTPGRMHPKLAGSPLGLELWAFLIRPDNLQKLDTAVEVGAAPVAAISRHLLREFGNGDYTLLPSEQFAQGLNARFPAQAPISVDTVKQMIGHMISQILETLDYSIGSRGSRANDGAGIFTSSARYR